MAAVFAHLGEVKEDDGGNDANAKNMAAVAEDRSTVPDYVLLFTVVMGSAFIGELFPPHVAALMRRNSWAKHLMALALLVVTVVWVRADMGIALLIGYTVITYAWYLAMTSMAASEFMLVVALLFVVFASSHMRRAAARSGAHATVGGTAGGTAGKTESGTAQTKEQTANEGGKGDKESKVKNWRYWLEFGALTGAASLTVLFTAGHALRSFMKDH